MVRVLQSVGVNEKMLMLWHFYFIDHSTFQPLQERALYLLKAFISKFFMAPKNKKILLEEKRAQLEVGKTASILEAVEWLHQRVFSQGIQDPQQLHQVIFQLMLSFYKYEEALTILNDNSIMNKHSINS